MIPIMIFRWTYIYIYWLVVSNICLFSIIYGIILPIDFHLFQRGSNHQPDNTSLMIFTRISAVWLGFSHPKMDVAVSSHFHWGLPKGALAGYRNLVPVPRSQCNQQSSGIYPLENKQFAIENGPVEIIDLPIKNGGSFHSFL